MMQQIVAIIIILFFLFRLLWQKKKDQISANEFIFWLLFWVVSALAIISLKSIDRIVAGFGFSSTGIEVLSYVAIIVLFYLIFRLRLRLEKIERNITNLVREAAIKKEKE